MKQIQASSGAKEPPMRSVLDHVGFIVEDLEASASLMQGLGFTLTVRADHSRTDLQQQQISTGSSQRSIMLESGYIELMQITDRSKGHPLASAIDVRFGLHVLALGTNDAQACHELCTSNNVLSGPVLNWSRPIHEPDIEGLAQFAYFGSAWTAQDPAFICWVQHLTPQLIQTPRLVQHANQAIGLTCVGFKGNQAQSMAWRNQLLAAGATAATTPHNLALPNARIGITVDDTAPSMRPYALALKFADLTGLHKRCEGLGLMVQDIDHKTITVDLNAQLGVFLHCSVGI